MGLKKWVIDTGMVASVVKLSFGKLVASRVPDVQRETGGDFLATLVTLSAEILVEHASYN
jgi:hypothetical protein